MGKIVYKGDDFRVLTAADFKKLGVEDQKKITFTNGEPVEVSDEVAKAILDMGEKFEISEAGPDPIDGTEVMTDKNSGATDQTGVASTNGTTAAGASKKSTPRSA